MFINKFKEKSVSDSSKMSSYINLFLKTEVTCIPKLLKNYIGDYYNNALFNGATWVFILWCVLHIVFDKLIDAFLKKLRYREYVRLRLKNSLWYLGFYGTAVVYSGAALAQNEVELFNFKKMHVPSSSNLPSQVVIGYTLISTFFLHSSLWEGLAKEYFLNMLSYLFLFFFLLASYTLRVVEISFTFTALVGIAQVAVEFTRCCFMSSIQDSFLSKVFVGFLYFTTYAIFFAVYIVVIPLTFIVPLGLKILSDYPNILLLFLFFNLVSWLLIEIYQSILFKFLDHWFYHQEETESDSFLQCSIGLLECSLFKPRDDISYNLQIIKKEIKARQTKMMSMRKPKNKTMLLQTLKCMMTIKKKLIDKRKSDSSDSESERSENINTDEHNEEVLSDQDEETDDESQESTLESEKTNDKISDHNEESDQIIEEIDPQISDTETVKGSAEETDKKSGSEGNSAADHNNDEECDHRSDKTVTSEDSTAKLEETVMDKQNTKTVKGSAEGINKKSGLESNSETGNNDEETKQSNKTVTSEGNTAKLEETVMDKQNTKTVKGSAEGINKKSGLESNSETGHNDEETEQSNKTFTSEGNTAKLEEAIVNKQSSDDDQTVKFYDGDNNTVQTVAEETESKNGNSGTLILEGDSKSKEMINTTKNEDSDNNNSVVSRHDNLLQITEENKDSIENSNVDVDEENKKNQKKSN